MTSDASLTFSSVESFFEPFRHIISANAFSGGVSWAALNWFEGNAPWKLVETDFYEQYEFSFLDAHPPAPLSFLREQSFLDDLRRKVGEKFSTGLGGRVDVTAHKLIKGQRIRLHNDFIPDQETHRLLIQLNRGWKDEDGGFLMFFNSSDPSDIHKVIRPTHNSLVGFAISPGSNHAVSTVHGGERFTLVYSFYGQGDA